MYNEELANKIISEHGRKAAMIYCKIEAKKNRDLSIELKERNIKDFPDEFKYEALWWENKFEQLKKEI